MYLTKRDRLSYNKGPGEYLELPWSRNYKFTETIYAEVASYTKGYMF